jgi:hypothetical protein
MSFLPNGQVMALAHFEDKLVVAGHFCAQLRDSVAANIAAWDGSDWSLFGEGLDGPVYSLAVFNGDLIAAGSFASSSGTPLNFIARWEDGQWLPVGDGANESIRTLAVHDSLLVAGGYFSSPGRNVAAWNGTRGVATWNGAEWASLGSGVDKGVRALARFDGALIAGGWFTRSGNQAVNHIAKWDGTEWTPLGSGLNGRVRAMAVYRNELVVGGIFTAAGGQEATYLAAWDGERWRGRF